MSLERDLPSEGPDAPPRRNGELVFEAPWEGRAFGLALALSERGVFRWEEFRRRLIGEIGAWDRAHPDGEGYRYYARWLAALESLLQERGLCAAAALDERSRELAARPAGHDHG